MTMQSSFQVFISAVNDTMALEDGVQEDEVCRAEDRLVPGRPDACVEEMSRKYLVLR